MVTSSIAKPHGSMLAFVQKWAECKHADMLQAAWAEAVVCGWLELLRQPRGARIRLECPHLLRLFALACMLLDSCSDTSALAHC